ncbi:sec-independent protein translocase protein tatb chloroplastic [Phtheirospermum japonicum]|uniref:Sec-independent protein translocase protein tatb chloroplastic n=1 Tax=Phtheirospermum japonicum TaxID=374723 RepID=A0A830BXW4_9LAMI|nr:sec-independent protein translocase protein tatb chloroplastic [Phtheirospermum japonicum]
MAIIAIIGLFYIDFMGIGGERMKGKCRGKGVFASLFGIGAPEALVIGVVALLIFGPKGLAEEVSREFKSSLEREIGLDEIDNRAPNSFISNNPMPTTLEDFGANVEPNKSSDDDSSPSSGGVYTAEEYLKVTETQLKGALARLQNENEEKEKDKNQSESQAPSQNTPQEEAASLVPPIPSPEPANEI